MYIHMPGASPKAGLSASLFWPTAVIAISRFHKVSTKHYLHIRSAKPLRSVFPSPVPGNFIKVLAVILVLLGDPTLNSVVGHWL